MAIKDAKEILNKMHEAWEGNITKRKMRRERSRKDVNYYRREPYYEVDSKVWLSTKNFAQDRPSSNLGHQNVGPFKFISKKRWAYELDLPTLIGLVHRFFHVELLRRDLFNSLPGQINPEAEQYEMIPGVKEWHVEAIRKYKQVYHKLHYRADCLGVDEDPEYYPASIFMYSPHLWMKFHLAHPALPGSPEALPSRIDAYEKGVNRYDEIEDSSLMKRKLKTSVFKDGG